MIKKLKFFALICLLVSISTKSFATDSKKAVLEFSDVSKNGKIDGCSLMFRSVARDEVYKGSNYILLWGWFGYMNINGVPAFTFKFAVTDLSKFEKNLKTNTSVPIESDYINYAYFKPLSSQLFSCSSGDVEKKLCESSSGKELNHNKSDSPKGAFFAVYNSDYLGHIGLTSADSVEIGFNRKKDGLDVKFILDISSAENISEMKKFSECINEQLSGSSR